MKCRMCSGTDETINHIVLEYSKLSQKALKGRHIWIEKRILRNISETNKPIWYERQPEMVIKNK